MLQLYQLKKGALLELEERRDGILIHQMPSVQNKIPWDAAYREMEAETADNGLPAEIAVDQIRTVSKSRLKERIDILSADAASAVRHSITEMYGLLSVS